MTNTRTLTRIHRSLVILSLAAAPAFCQVPRQQTAPAAGCALSSAAVLNWLDGAKSDPKQFNPDFLIARINKCGISFDLTNESRSDIQKHGGSAKLITALERAAKYVEPPKTPAPPSPPPPPPPKPQGQLTVTCQPVECEVSVEGSPIGTTVGGALSRSWDVGPITVSVAKVDYDPDKNREIAAIKEGETARVDFKLKPSLAGLEAAGGKLFQRMLEALGGDAGLKASGFVRGTGTLNCYRDGKPTTWDVRVLMRVPDAARFTIHRGAQNYEAAQTRDGLQWQKLPKPADGDDLENPLRMLQQYQISEVIGHLRSKGFRLVAERLAPVPGEDTVLHATAGSERTVITLDPEFRPKEIVLESAGLDSGRKIVYSGYIQKENASHPKSLQVILPGAAGNGFELKFLDVEFNPPNVNEADFGLKKPGKQPKKK